MRIVILLCATQVLHAQTSDGAVSLRLIDPHPFRQGELITAEVKLPEFDGAPDRPATEQWQSAGFLVDPPAGCGTLAKPCVADEPGGVVSGIWNGPRSQRDLQTFPLNSSLRALPPGHYRVSALARKLVLRNLRPGVTTYLYADPPQYSTSPSVEIDIVPASAAWIKATVARCVTTLKAPQPRDSDGYRVQRDAAEQLAFLDDPAAWTASLDLLPTEEPVLLAGLRRARPSARVCDLMQARVATPSQSVSTSFLYQLSEVCAQANLPPAPVPPPGPAGAAVAVGVLSTAPPPGPVSLSPEMRAWLEQRSAYTREIMDRAAAALAGGLAAKQGPTKWASFVTLIEHINQVRSDRPHAPDPVWIPLLTTEFAREFASVEPARKQYLLDMYASSINSPEVAPLFESVMDSWKPGDYYEAPRSALQALSRIDPARGRARILAELAKEKTWLDVSSLDLLPPALAPPMDDALFQALARAQGPGGWNTQLTMAAIARYASPKALPRIRAIYESQSQSCQPELAAYFVRVDAAYADRIFHGHAWDMHAPPPPCTLQYFQRTSRLAMGPPLERYLIAYLMHSDVHVKTTAAQVLAHYGTASALPPLWDTLRYFHEYWQGKNAELERLGEGVELEVALRNAIAHGRGWLVTEADVRLIESLCISGRCVAETRQDLESIKAPLHIEITGQPLGVMGRVAQYFWLESMAAMKSKLAQYPRGTQFVLTAPGGPTMQVADEIRRFAAEKGLIVQ